MMKIGISQNYEKGKFRDRDTLEQNYTNYFHKFGITLIPLPNNKKIIKHYLESFNLRGIILSGGNDIGEFEERDKTEKIILDTTIKKNIPVFGICRGMQFINFYFGGEINKKIKNHINKDHSVDIIDKKFGEYMQKKSMIVNSYHGQGILEQNLSSELKSFVKASEEVIEGLFHPNLPIAGIQWHPERPCINPEINKKIIKAFLNKRLYWN